MILFDPRLPAALVCAHLLGDFVFQPDRMVAAKHRGEVLALHGVVHAALAYVLAGCWTCWQLPLAVFVAHALIDDIKHRFGSRGPRATIFWADQLAHLATIVLFSAIWIPLTRDNAWARLGFSSNLTGICVLASGAIIAIRVAAIVIGFWVEPYLAQLAPTSSALRSPMGRGLPNGGRLIGQWERALIFLFVMLDLPTAVGFLIAAKSIFRFGELSDRQNRMEAEYITIGTLMSFGVALTTAYATTALCRWM